MKRILIIATSIAILCVAGWSDPLILDLPTSIELALENNPDFKIAGIGLETASRAERNIWNQFLPNISASAGVSRASAGGGSPGWGFRGSLDAELSLNSSLAYTIREIGLAYESEAISYETARLNLVAEVEQTFAYLVAAEADMGIEKANLDLARKRYDQTTTNFSHGLASELEVLQAEVTAANLEPTYLQTVADYEARVREFLIVLGLDPETEIVLDGDLDSEVVEFDVDDLIVRFLENRQDIRDLRLTLEILNNQRKQVLFAPSGGLVPSLNLSVGWTEGASYGFKSRSWQYDDWTDGFIAGIGVTIPLDGLIPGSSDSLSVKAVNDQIESASVTLAKAVYEARTEIINLVEQLKTSAASMELSRLTVELARKSYEMSEESFSRGTVQRLDVEDAQQEYFEARQQYLLSQYAYLSGLIDLRVALGLESWDELNG